MSEKVTKDDMLKHLRKRIHYYAAKTNNLYEVRGSEVKELHDKNIREGSVVSAIYSIIKSWPGAVKREVITDFLADESNLEWLEDFGDAEKFLYFALTKLGIPVED